jgi:hypothetical protein
MTATSRTPDRLCWLLTRSPAGCRSSPTGPDVAPGNADRDANELAVSGDQTQYDEGEGPCLDAAMTQRWVYTPDTGADRRWPRSCGRMAKELGVGSLLSCRLSMEATPGRTLAGINLYLDRQGRLR